MMFENIFSTQVVLVLIDLGFNISSPSTGRILEPESRLLLLIYHFIVSEILTRLPLYRDL